MIKIDQGGEYEGETYIWCERCAPPGRRGLYFKGSSVDELLAFIAEHTHGPIR